MGQGRLEDQCEDKESKLGDSGLVGGRLGALKHMFPGRPTSPDCALFVSRTERKTLGQPEVVGNYFFFFLVQKETTLPFPEQFISLLDKTPCYIYPTKIADDILPAALLSNAVAHGPANHLSQNKRKRSTEKLLTPQREEREEERGGRQEGETRGERERETLWGQIHISFAGWLLM